MNRYNGVMNINNTIMSINNAVVRIHGGIFKAPRALAGGLQARVTNSRQRGLMCKDQVLTPRHHIQKLESGP